MPKRKVANPVMVPSQKQSKGLEGRVLNPEALKVTSCSLWKKLVHRKLKSPQRKLKNWADPCMRNAKERYNRYDIKGGIDNKQGVIWFVLVCWLERCLGLALLNKSLATAKRQLNHMAGHLKPVLLANPYSQLLNNPKEWMNAIYSWLSCVLCVKRCEWWLGSRPLDDFVGLSSIFFFITFLPKIHPVMAKEANKRPSGGHIPPKSPWFGLTGNPGRSSDSLASYVMLHIIFSFDGTLQLH